MRNALLRFIPLLLLTGGCVHRPPTGPTSGQVYRAVWTVRNAADSKPLAGVTSPPVRVGGGELRVRTDSQHAEVNQPAFPEFLARLTPLPRSALIQLVTRVTVLEAVRTKKGKLKIHQRFIGALLPIRPGEKLGVNGPGDSYRVEVELEAAR